MAAPSADDGLPTLPLAELALPFGDVSAELASASESQIDVLRARFEPIGSRDF